MHLYLRWNGCLRNYIFFTSNFSTIEEKKGKICKFCLKNYKAGTLIRSRVFFSDPSSLRLKLSSLDIEKANKAILPIDVYEEAIVLDKRHVDLVHVGVKNLHKAFKTLINEALRLLSMGFNRIIFTFQSRIITQGTLSHPQIRIFALDIPAIVNELSVERIRGNYEVLHSTGYHLAAYPFIRENPISIIVLDRDLNYLDLASYSEKERLIDLVNIIHESILLLDNLSFLGVINVFNEKFYVRIIHYNDPEIIWPIFAFKAAGLRIIRADLEEYDLLMSELKKSWGNHNGR